MNNLQKAAQQALEALGSSLYPQPRQVAAIAALRAALAEYDDEPTYCPTCGEEDGGTTCGMPDCGLRLGADSVQDWALLEATQASLREHMAEIHRLRAALAEPTGKVNVIKTWNERCETHPDHQTGMVSNLMIQARMQEEIDELRAALAEPVQEPVAWRYQDSRGNYRYRGYVQGFKKEYWRLKPVPLYTTPPQRKPLTEEEIDRLWRDPQQGDWDHRNFTRAIERAHGIGT